MIIPVFNKEGEINALYCSNHKLEGMINVKHETCIHEGCNISPAFNKENETKALYCSKHKIEGMINIISHTCIHEGCKILPVFNNEGSTKALYCSKHKIEGMVNVISQTCKNEWCLTQVQEKYNGYCLFCYINMFPDKPVSRNYKTKEYAVVEFVKTTFPDLSWISENEGTFRSFSYLFDGFDDDQLTNCRLCILSVCVHIGSVDRKERLKS